LGFLLYKSASYPSVASWTISCPGPVITSIFCPVVKPIAGRELTVAADRDVSLRAGRNVEIGAATETDSHYQLKEKKKSGLLGSGGIGFTIGRQSGLRREISHGRRAR